MLYSDSLKLTLFYILANEAFSPATAQYNDTGVEYQANSLGCANVDTRDACQSCITNCWAVNLHCGMTCWQNGWDNVQCTVSLITKFQSLIELTSGSELPNGLCRSGDMRSVHPTMLSGICVRQLHRSYCPVEYVLSSINISNLHRPSTYQLYRCKGSYGELGFCAPSGSAIFPDNNGDLHPFRTEQLVH